MYLIGVASPKGGVGKTTTAWHLSAFYAKHGLKVCLTDLDEAKSAIDSYDPNNNIGFVVRAVIPDKSEGFDVCIIDHAPGTRSSIIGDVIVRPLQANGLDYRNFQRATPMFSGFTVIPVITKFRVKCQNQVLLSKKEELDGAILIPLRDVFAETISNKMTLYQSKKASKTKAIQDIAVLAQRVKECLMN